MSRELERNARSPDASEGRGLAWLHGIWGMWWVILLVALAVVGAVGAWTMHQRPVYEAVTVIEYDPNPPRPLGREVEDVAQPVSNFWMAREFFETQNRILSSRVVAAAVVSSLQLHHDPEFCGVPPESRPGWPGISVDDAALVLQPRIRVQPVRDTRLVQIRVEDTDPARAQAIANAIADEYLRKTMDDRLASTVSALEWLGDQLNDLRRRLEGSEQALHDFKREHNVLSLSMEDRQNLVANEIENLSSALTEIRVRRVEAESALQQLERAQRGDPLEASAGALLGRPTLDQLRQTLHTKIAERRALELRYGDAHPSMRAIDSEIESLHQQLRMEIDTVVASQRAQVAELRRSEQALENARDAAHHAGLELNLLEIEYGRLSRNAESDEQLYELLLQRSAETDLTRMLRVTHVRILDRALRPTHPIRPRVALNLTGGSVFGVALGLALALLLLRMDRRLRDVSDVDALGTPVLGLVPAIESQNSGGPKRRRRGRVEARDPDRDLISFKQPMSQTAEALRTVRTNLTFMATDRMFRSLVVTSAAPREGKTTMAVNLAITFAQSGRRVLLIDSDLRKPRVHRAFGLGMGVGVTTVLAGEATLEDAIRKTEVPCLDILACGPLPPNPSELLLSKRFSALREAAMDAYDLVIFDSPPVGVVTDGAVLAPQVDAVVLVARAGQTSRDALRGVIQQLRGIGANIVGAVLNGVDLRSRRYGGYYQYGAGYYGGTDLDEDGSAEPSPDVPERPA